MSEGTIVITSWPLDKGHEESFKISDSDEELCKAIKRYYEQVLEPDDIELFLIQDNIIVTEKGFFGAFYMKDFKAANEEKSEEEYY